MAGCIDGRAATESGKSIDADVVIWCTGYRGDFTWLKVPGVTFTERGYPDAPFGVPAGVPGLAFVGMPHQTSLASHLLGGVGADVADAVRAAVGDPSARSAHAA